MGTRLISLVGALVVMLGAATAAATASDGRDLQDGEPAQRIVPDDGRLDWWREARFGMFIHWGLYAVPAGEWNGQTHHAEWIMATAGIPVEEYEQFVEAFNPVNFDADAWCRMAKDTGMRYIVITTKHHDGFSLFDTAHTDYDIMSTPFARDIMAELAPAARRHGLKIGWYHSILDWHHPDHQAGPAMERYIAYLRAQVTELLTNYGDIGVMWFDGEWEPLWTHEAGRELYRLCLSLQPNVIVNNRVDKGRDGMAGLTRAGAYYGDFGTPEQEVPAQGLSGVDWESCITMNDHWGFNAADKNFKSTTELIHLLVDVASKGGNLLLNVGPRADGTFPPESVKRLDKIGDWMEVNGESIYGTQASVFEELSWGRCTVDARETAVTGKSTLYLHVFDWPAGGTLALEGLSNQIAHANALADPSRAIDIQQRDGRVFLDVGSRAPDEHCSVVKLIVEGEPIVIHPPRISAVSNVFVDALDVSISKSDPALTARYTIDGRTPTIESPAFGADPVRVWTSAVVSVRLFEGTKPVSGVRTAEFEKIPLHPPAQWSGETDRGLKCELFDGTWNTLPVFDEIASTRAFVAPVVDLASVDAGREHFGLRMRGLLHVETGGLYSFGLTSDDGARLWIDGALVVDNDGLHVAQERTGQIALAAGDHWIEVEYFNRTGQATLELTLGLVGQERVRASAEQLKHVR